PGGNKPIDHGDTIHVPPSDSGNARSACWNDRRPRRSCRPGLLAEELIFTGTGAVSPFSPVIQLNLHQWDRYPWPLFSLQSQLRGEKRVMRSRSPEISWN